MKQIATQISEKMGVYPVGTSACFDIGISGYCKGNCYKCQAFYDDDMTDQDVINIVGKDEQEKMLREYEES
jgi:hypothetical protein